MGSANPHGRRFWGPRGNLQVRYFSNTRRVDPAGDAAITLAESDRELGDEADRIELNRTPTDMKTMAFVLLVEDGVPSGRTTAISLVDQFGPTWQLYGNGPATGGLGKFATRLDPAIH